MAFTFSYYGKVKRNADPQTVAEKLAAHFGVDAAELDGLFNGEAHFERRGLNEFIAKSYQRLFDQAGAIGFMVDENESEALAISESAASVTTPLSSPVSAQTLPGKKVNSPERPACPKCGSGNIDREQCRDCGIYIEKYRARLNKPGADNKSVEESAEADAETYDDEELAGQASVWLKITATVLVIVFTADSYLQDLSTPTNAGIDMGYWPYIFAHLLLLRACFVYAKAKGYSGMLGLLGLASLAGFAILVVLKPKRGEERDSRTLTIEWLSAAFCIGVTIYAASQVVPKFQAIARLEERALSLRAQRNEYPSPTLDSDANLIYREEEEIKAFVNDGFSAVYELKLRPNQISTVMELVFSELARYEAWRNYQTYLHYQNKTALPTPLQKEMEKTHDQSFAELLPDNNNEEFHPRQRQSQTDWLIGQNMDVGPQIWRQLYEHLSRTMDSGLGLWRLEVEKSQELEAYQPAIDLNSIPIASNQRFEVKVNNKNTLTYSAAIGPLAETPLVVAFYVTPYQRRSQNGMQTRYQFETAVISPGFPNKYLYGMFNLLTDYFIYPE